MFLKRLLFLKAALDNDNAIGNFAVPFEEDKAFNLKPGESKPSYYTNPNDNNNNSRAGVQTAPAEGNGKRKRLNQYGLDDDPSDKPLALTNGGINDDLNESGMKALLPPQAPPRPSKTA